jgi:hypothetical protein
LFQLLSGIGEDLLFPRDVFWSLTPDVQEIPSLFASISSKSGASGAEFGVEGTQSNTNIVLIIIKRKANITG